ncbi:MAG: glycosyltransferase family 9 protein [Gilvibacter sp.]
MNILVIQHKMIGDVLTTSLLFELLRGLYPEATLHYLINKNTQAVVQGNPFIDKLWLFTSEMSDNKGLKKSFHKEIIDVRFDLVIDVYAKLGSALLTYKIKPKHSISYHKWYTELAYKKTVWPKSHTEKNERLAITNRVLLLEKLGHTVDQIPAPKIYLEASEIDKARKLLSEANLNNTKPLFMISLLGSGDIKTYPLEYMAKVLDSLVAQSNANLLLNYIPNQRPSVDALLEHCNSNTRANIYDQIYGSSLREFMALTSHCDALIGNEGGAVNIAKALDVPTYSIYAPWILKSAWNSYEASGNNRSIHLQDIHPELYSKHPKKYKKQAASLYKQLTPDYVIADLKQFLSQHQFLVSKP